jgi:hypothetical protein
MGLGILKRVPLRRMDLNRDVLTGVEILHQKRKPALRGEWQAPSHQLPELRYHIVQASLNQGTVTDA